MKYSLYTEDKNRLLVKQIVSKQFDGASFFYGEGLYKGNEEKSILIEIFTDKDELVKIMAVVREIKAVNEQESIGVSTQGCGKLAFL